MGVQDSLRVVDVALQHGARVRQVRVIAEATRDGVDDDGGVGHLVAPRGALSLAQRAVASACATHCIAIATPNVRSVHGGGKLREGAQAALDAEGAAVVTDRLAVVSDDVAKGAAGAVEAVAADAVRTLAGVVDQLIVG